ACILCECCKRGTPLYIRSYGGQALNENLRMAASRRGNARASIQTPRGMSGAIFIDPGTPPVTSTPSSLPLPPDPPEYARRKLLPLRCPHGVFIDVEAEALPLRQRDVAVGRAQRIRAQPLAELLERQEILGDDEIRHAGGSVHGGGQCHGGRIVIVRRD